MYFDMKSWSNFNCAYIGISIPFWHVWRKDDHLQWYKDLSHIPLKSIVPGSDGFNAISAGHCHE